MEMTDAEICKNYREAKNKNAQIGILADLNRCKPEFIKGLLIFYGEKVSGNRGDKVAEVVKRLREKDREAAMAAADGIAARIFGKNTEEELEEFTKKARAEKASADEKAEEVVEAEELTTDQSATPSDCILFEGKERENKYEQLKGSGNLELSEEEAKFVKEAIFKAIDGVECNADQFDEQIEALKAEFDVTVAKLRTELDENIARINETKEKHFRKAFVLDGFLSKIGLM